MSEAPARSEPSNVQPAHSQPASAHPAMSDSPAADSPAPFGPANRQPAVSGERLGPTPALRSAAAVAAGVVGLLSLVYAVFYLFVAPSVQRGSDLDAALRSYVEDPTGLRVASVCLIISGLLTTVVYAALHATSGRLTSSVRTWALVLGLVSGVATTAHGLADLIDLDKIANAYVRGDATTQAAVTALRATTSQVDPRGLATFGIVGVVIFVFSRHLRHHDRFIAILGQILGVDMVLLFLASAFASAIPILITGGLASVILGPLWWISVGLWLYRGSRVPSKTAPRP